MLEIGTTEKTHYTSAYRQPTQPSGIKTGQSCKSPQPCQSAYNEKGNRRQTRCTAAGQKSVRIYGVPTVEVRYTKLG